MSPDVSAYVPLILLVLLVLALIIWLVLRANRKAQIVDRDGSRLARDVLDEGADKAARNQALIDAPPAVAAALAEPGPLAAAEPAPAPTPAPAPAPAAAPVAAPATGDLARLKGVGPKLEALLASLGVTSLAQIAEWSDADIDRIDAALGRFQGRIRRDQWVEQARLLAAGDEAGFASRFGRIGD